MGNAAEVIDVAYFEVPDRKVQTAVRLPKSLLEQLDGVVRLWRAMAEARGEGSESVDRAYVINRLLRVGVDGAFAEVGGYPVDATDDAWERVLRAARQGIKKNQK